MPSIKELMTPQNVGIMIYAEVMPIPGGVLEKVEKAEKAFERLGLGGMPERVVLPATYPEKTPRVRASINNDIVAFLSTEPLTTRTPRQVWGAIRSAYPKQTTETVQTRMKKEAGKSGLWIPVGNKYGMPGAEGAAKTPAAAANASAKAAAPAGTKREDLIYGHVVTHPGCAKADVIAIWKGQMFNGKEIQPKYIGIDLGRLVKAKKITGGKTGPYWPAAAAAAAEQPTA